MRAPNVGRYRYNHLTTTRQNSNDSENHFISSHTTRPYSPMFRHFAATHSSGFFSFGIFVSKLKNDV